MIKQLIKDLSFDKITLNQGLTRAKIIAHTIGDKSFQTWLKLEIDGYPHNSSSLPSYRRLNCVVKITLSDFFGRQNETSVSFKGGDPEIAKMMTQLEVINSISSIEENIKMLKETKGIIDFNPNQIQLLSEWFASQIGDSTIVRAGREVKKIEYINIVEQTKQKLLDVLLELDSQFPNLDDEFSMTTENQEKVRNIITTNIYGNNNPLNIASGESVSQHDNTNNISPIDYSVLSELGVEKSFIVELQKIVSGTPKEGGQLKQKVLKWLGAVSTSVVGKGLSDKLPQITEFVGQLF